jgi:hypothetical protein
MEFNGRAASNLKTVRVYALVGSESHPLRHKPTSLR